MAIDPERDPLEASEDLNQNLELVSSPIHAMAPANHWLFKPGTDPVAIAGELPDPGGGEGDVIAVVDTGIAPGGPAWADQPYVVYETVDEEPQGFEASHGTFITGLIRTLAPDNRVSMARARTYAELVASDHNAPTVPLSD